MMRRLRPTNQCQRAASLALVNVAFVALLTWLLAGTLPHGIDSMPTASIAGMLVR